MTATQIGTDDLIRLSANRPRKAIYLELHPETGHGGDRKSDQVENFATRSFAKETAEKTGTSDRLVRLNAERGEKVIDAAIDLIRGTVLRSISCPLTIRHSL